MLVELACQPQNSNPRLLLEYIRGMPGGEWILPHWQNTPPTLIVVKETDGWEHTRELYLAAFTAYPGHQAVSKFARSATPRSYLSVMPSFVVELMQWEETDETFYEPTILTLPEHIEALVSKERTAYLLTQLWGKDGGYRGALERFIATVEASERWGIALEELCELTMLTWNADPEAPWENALGKAHLLAS